MPFDIWGVDENGDEVASQPLGLEVDPDQLSNNVKNSIFNQFAPSLQQVEAKQEEQSSGVWGTIGTILSLPEKVFFGQSIKGAVKGFAEDGLAGAAKGFVRGSPFAFLGEALGLGDWADETRATDIRKAFGQDDVEEGWGNFFINLASEVLLSPIELMVAPFGLTAKGADAAARGVAKASIAKAVATGERAALTFKVPWAKAGFASTNLGFKSGPVLVGQGLDAIAGFMRTNAFTGPVVRMFSHAADIYDPEKAAQAAKAVVAGDAAKRGFTGVVLKAYQDLSPEARKLVEAGEHGKIISFLQEFGVDDIDKLGTYAEATKRIENADVYIRELRRDALLAHPNGAKLKKLWIKAQSGDADAITRIMEQYPEVPLRKEMLDAIGVAPRVGVEESWTKSTPALSEKLADATPVVNTATGKTTGTFERAVVAENTPDLAAEAVTKARTEAVGLYKKITDEIKAGTVSKDALNEWLAFHRQQMINFGRSDITNGFLNKMSEPFLGLYSPHIMSKGAMDLIEEHWASTLSKYDYRSARKLRDMTALEINAIAEDFGTRATGFASMKKLRDSRPELVLSAIFDKPFLRGLRKVDPEAADLFQILPVQNLFDRAAASAERIAQKSLGDVFYEYKVVDGETVGNVLEVHTPESFARNAERLLDPKSQNVAVVQTRSTLKALDRASAIEMAAGTEVAAQYENALYVVREDALARMLKSEDSASKAIEQLRSVHKITEDIDADLLGQHSDDIHAVVQAKRAALDVKTAARNAEESSMLLRVHDGEFRGGFVAKTPSEIAAQATYRELKSAAQGVDSETFYKQLQRRAKDAQDALKAARVTHKSFRYAADDLLEEMAQHIDETKVGIRQTRDEALAAIATDKAGRLDIIKRLRENGMSGTEFAQEVALQKQYAAHGVLALDEAAKHPMPGGGTLLDRMMKRFDPDTQIKIVSRESHEAYKKIASDLVKPDAWRDGAVVHALDAIKTSWAGHTIYNPLFLQTRARNFVQNIIASMSGNLFSPMAHMDAATSMRALRKSIESGVDNLAALDGQFVTGTKIPLGQAFGDARKLGVIGAGGYAFEAGLTVEQAALMRGGATAKEYAKDVFTLLVPGKRGVKDSPFLQLGYKMESMLDDHARLAAYYKGLKNGLTPENAALEVRKWLYDSSRPMTWTERTLFRRIMPFYSFQKYAVGQAFDLYFQKPGLMGSFEKIRRNMTESKGIDPKDLDTVLPRYIADGYGIPIRNGDRGPEVGLFGTFLPIGEVSKIASAFDAEMAGENAVNPMVRYVFSNMHPVIRGGIEMALQRDIYANRPIEDYPGQQVELFGLSVSKKVARWAQQLRFVNELNRLNLLNLSEAKVMIDAVDRDSQRAQSTFLTRLASSAFSPLPIPKTYSVDVGHEGRYRQAKDEEAWRSNKGRLMRRVIGPAKDTSVAEIAALQDEMATNAANLRRRNEVMERWDDPNREPPKMRRNALERLLLPPGR